MLECAGTWMVPVIGGVMAGLAAGALALELPERGVESPAPAPPPPALDWPWRLLSLHLVCSEATE